MGWDRMGDGTMKWALEPWKGRRGAAALGSGDGHVREQWSLGVTAYIVTKRANGDGGTNG
jgi:hypothetical protein